MNVDRLVEQARELLEPFGDVRHFDVLVPTALLAGLADAVERLRDDNRRLRTEAVGLTEDGSTVPELESEVERLQRDNDLALRAMGEYWEERDAARDRAAALEAAIAEHRVDVTGDGRANDTMLRMDLDERLWALLDGRVPSTGQETT